MIGRRQSLAQRAALAAAIGVSLAACSPQPAARNTNQLVYTEAAVNVPTAISASDGYIAFAAPREGGPVIAYYDTRSGTIVDTQVPTEFPNSIQMSGTIIAFAVTEAGLGLDFTADGDTGDVVAAFYDVASGNVSYTAWPIGYPDSISVSGDLIAFSSSEWDLGWDVTGDGDALDNVVAYLETATGNPNYTAVETVNVLSVSDGVIAFETREDYLGEDLTGDGDAIDRLVGYYSTVSGLTWYTSLQPSFSSPVVISGDLIAFSSSEHDLGLDLTGDGLTQATIVAYYGLGLSHAAFTNAPTEGALSVSAGRIAFATSEAWSGGEGGTRGHTIAYYDVAAGEVTWTGALANPPAVPLSPGRWLSISENVVAFPSSESFVGRDLNGNGFKGDSILAYVMIEAATTER